LQSADQPDLRCYEIDLEELVRIAQRLFSVEVSNRGLKWQFIARNVVSATSDRLRLGPRSKQKSR
jgi:hypothetical protein